MQKKGKDCCDYRNSGSSKRLEIPHILQLPPFTASWSVFEASPIAAGVFPSFSITSHALPMRPAGGLFPHRNPSSLSLSVRQAIFGGWSDHPTKYTSEVVWFGGDKLGLAGRKGGRDSVAPSVASRRSTSILAAAYESGRCMIPKDWMTALPMILNL